MNLDDMLKEQAKLTHGVPKFLLNVAGYGWQFTKYMAENLPKAILEKTQEIQTKRSEASSMSDRELKEKYMDSKGFFGNSTDESVYASELRSRGYGRKKSDD